MGVGGFPGRRQGKGQRARRGDNRFKDRGGMVSPLQTTSDIAVEIGLSEHGAQQRMQIARDYGPISCPLHA